MFKYRLYIVVNSKFGFREAINKEAEKREEIVYDFEFINPINPGCRVKIGKLELVVKKPTLVEVEEKGEYHNTPLHDLSSGITELITVLAVPKDNFDETVEYLKKQIK